MQPGTRLGHYEILSALGKGGMGEVWRARDAQLGREVAIKTLPEAFAHDSERLARFEREARLLAAVNHPNIAVIYGLEESEGERFLALELVEGETLAERLHRGAIPVEEALRLALQIAEALEAAHERGVVHRDLKPANIKVTPEGKAKVLDFGLAKVFGAGAGEEGLSNSPTLSLAAAERGVVFGTAAYMAPEQARGEAVDARADVWAFGCILFEMLTGKGTFDGKTTSDVLASVLKVDPDWGRLPPNLHPRIEHLLERCLDKEPRDRYQGIADARVEIQKVLADPRGVLVRPAADSPRERRRWTVVLAASVAGALLVSAFITGIVVRHLQPSVPAPVVRFTEALPQGPFGEQVVYSVIDISRDGTRIAYTAGPALGQERLYVRNVDETVARPVGGAVGALYEPRFSPDGQWLAYVQAPPTIRRVPAGGGTPQAVVSGLAPVSGMDWDERGMLLYSQPEGIYEVPALGGEPRLIVPARDDEVLARPRRLPGGDAVLFTAASGTNGVDWDAGEIVVFSPGSGERTVVWRGGRDARYVRSGHLVFARANTLSAVPFDLARLQVSGNLERVIDQGVRGSFIAFPSSAQYAVSDTGTLVRLEVPDNVGGPRRTFVWVQRDGTEEPISVEADDYTMARISPDGSRVALVLGDSLSPPWNPDIWILDLETESTRRLTFDWAADGLVWSPDGERIYFRSMREAYLRSPGEAETGIYAVSAEGGEPELIAPHTPDFPFALPQSISPDGETLGLLHGLTFTDFRIATLGVRPGSEFRELFRGANHPAFSPSGSWMAYTESGAPDGAPSRLRVRSYPDVGRTEIPVASAGEMPVFSRDGRELFFVADGAIWSAPVRYEPSFSAGAPELAIRGVYRYGGGGGRAWDPHPDGERFLMIRDADGPQSETAAEADRFRLHVVLNWAEELRRRVPAR